MTTLACNVADSTTMLRRVVRHTGRNPSVVIMSFVLPLVMLLLFNYAFGGALNSGGVTYINYVVPGVLMMGVVYSVQATALAVNADVSEGIIDRFRTMPIARTAVLTGHVVASTLRTLVGLALVIGVALAIGFRPTANPLRWGAVIGLVALLLFALAWLATAFGLAAKTATGAGGMSAIVSLFPFLSGAFVPTDTMPGWLRVFTANQPLTQVIDALRGLLLGGPVGDHAWSAVAWCAGIAAGGYVWSRSLYSRRAAQ